VYDEFFFKFLLITLNNYLVYIDKHYMEE